MQIFCFHNHDAGRRITNNAGEQNKTVNNGHNKRGAQLIANGSVFLVDLKSDLLFQGQIWIIQVKRWGRIKIIHNTIIGLSIGKRGCDEIIGWIDIA